MWEKMITSMLPGIIEKASPEIRKMLEGLVGSLKEKARKTSNPIDDALVALLAAVLGLKFKG